MTRSQSRQLFLKHVCDRVLSALLLALTAPLWLAIAAAVRWDSPGAALFRQERVGRNGRRFTVYKFRSMVHDADKLLDERGCVVGNRVTRVGRLLRKTSLDELPQLLNIVRGEMSFVGPRPILPEHLGRYDGPGELRFRVRPGVTGLAQVSGRNSIPWSKRVELDLEYVNCFSLWLDTKISIRTVGVVLTAAGVVMDRNPDQVDDLSPALAKGEVAVFNGRNESVMRGGFRKDPGYEHLLSTMNEALAESHDALLGEAVDAPPTIHVIGSPRSGTTLLTQVLATGLDVSYVNNLVAAFWRAPVYGVRLSQKLLPDARPTGFTSCCGRTSGIAEPHEFGYFWSDLLGYAELRQQAKSFESTIDWQRVRRVLAGMTQAAGCPVLFKSFLLAWHLRRATEEMPATRWVWVRRDPVDTAISILRARRSVYGDESRWFGVMPLQYNWLRHESPETQAAGQVYFFERAIEEQAATLPAGALTCVNYEELVISPQQVVTRVAEELRPSGVSQREHSLPANFDATASPADSDRRERIASALASFAACSDAGRADRAA